MKTKANLPVFVKPVDNDVMSPKDVQFHVPSVVDDRTPLPQYQGFHRQKFVLDLRDLKLMNSVGIRNWVQWLKSFQPQNEVCLVNCPVIFMNIAAIVTDVVPDGARIESILLRYVDEEHGRGALRVLAQRPTESSWKLPQAILSASGEVYEFDGILSKTLGRLKGQVELVNEMPEAAIAGAGLTILSKE